MVSKSLSVNQYKLCFRHSANKLETTNKKGLLKTSIFLYNFTKKLNLREIQLAKIRAQANFRQQVSSMFKNSSKMNTRCSPVLRINFNKMEFG